MQKIRVNPAALSAAIQEGLLVTQDLADDGFEVEVGQYAGMKLRLVADPLEREIYTDYPVLASERHRCITEEAPVKTIYVDTETTGFDPSKGDEILEISIIDDEGNTLVNSLVRPVGKTSWPEAQAVNGITPDMVASAPLLAELAPQIVAAFRGARVVMYHAAFDIEFLKPILTGLQEGKDYHLHCALRRFSVVRGVWDGRTVGNGNYKRWKLVAAAEYVGHVWRGAAHRALEDAWATRAVWRWTLQEMPEAVDSPLPPAKLRSLLMDAWGQTVPLTQAHFDQFMKAVNELRGMMP